MSKHSWMVIYIKEQLVLPRVTEREHVPHIGDPEAKESFESRSSFTC